MAGLGQQLLGRRNVLAHEVELGVLGMDRADMVMLAGRTETSIGRLKHLVGVDGETHGLAHPGVGERADGLHARDSGLGRGRLMDVHMRHCLIGVERQHVVDDVEAMHLFRCEGAQGRRGIVAQVVEFDPVHIRPIVPVIVARLEYRDLADLVLDQVERPGAVGADTELAAFLGIEDREGIVEKMLGNRQLRLLGVEPHRMAIDDLDGVGVPQLGGLRIAFTDFVEHVALHQTEHR